ncbi:hypothetical protein C8J57DRAFT_1169805 [Mycena rebaudengoi]|nr:hypothetical protein C8J57DRAFT_1169805 [Mycena rebaudengoi]
MRIILDHSGERFEKFRAAVNKSLPVTPDQIDLHTTPLHPIPTWNIDQSTIIGNEEEVDAIHTELEVKKLSHWQRIVRFFAGDQLTIARLRSLLNIRAGHEGGYAGFGWGVWMPGLFHAKIADMHGFFVTHWGVPNRGTRNPGSLSFHNTHLHRTPILLTSLPPFRTCRDLVFVSLYARVLHCLLLVTNTSTLNECAASIETFEQLEAHAGVIQEKYSNPTLVSQLRWQRKMATGSEGLLPGDEIFENASLFLRDALVSREFTDSVKAGDSGRIVLILKILACSYRGNGRTKYAYEMLHVIHNLTHVWPPHIRKIVLNNWLLNPTGNPFSWVEADLMQEHMNYWIKTIYQAHGSAASWEWLEMISPCISILRQLSTMITRVLGTDQGTQHEPADLTEDIDVLMSSLSEHSVYQVQGRFFSEGDGSSTPDVVSVGGQQLTDSSSNPLTEYNTTFRKLQMRCRQRPLVGESSSDSISSETPATTITQDTIGSLTSQALGGSSLDLIPVLSDERSTTSDSEDDAASAGSEVDDPEDHDDESGNLSAFEQALEGDAEPTLTLDTAADVSLDMDGGGDGFLAAEDSDSEPEDLYLDDGAIDNSDDDYVDE